jgi:hypothetical protein
VADLEDVLREPMKSVKRSGVALDATPKLNLTAAPGAASMSMLPEFRRAYSLSDAKPPQISVNYNIMALHHFETRQAHGLVLIIDDVTTLATMKKQVKEMKSRLARADMDMLSDEGVQSSTPL